MTRLAGTYTALVTPFTSEGSLDYPALARLIDFQFDNGIDGLVICGTTGEKATLTEDEFRKLAAFANKQAKGRGSMILGTGGNDTARAIEHNRLAAELGYDYALTVCPYYNKPSQEGLYRHFVAQAELSPLPLVLYNVPGRTGVNMTAATALRLAKVPGIIAIKEASGNLAQIGDILAGRPEHFSVLSGDDSLTLPMLALGADGLISVATNQIPKPLSTMVQMGLQGNFAAARALHFQWLQLMDGNFIESNPVPAKYVLSKMGLIGPTVRLPLAPLTSDSAKKLDTMVQAAGLSSV